MVNKKKPRGTWEVRPRFGFTALFYIVTSGHSFLLEQRHHQFISFNPFIFANVLSMGELIKGFKEHVKIFFIIATGIFFLTNSNV